MDNSDIQEPPAAPKHQNQNMTNSAAQMTFKLYLFVELWISQVYSNSRHFHHLQFPPVAEAMGGIASTASPSPLPTPSHLHCLFVGLSIS